ncbi:MAG TPA: hypothetical protein VGJ54_03215, partial [Streptosporangiaceae bacterium]
MRQIRLSKRQRAASSRLEPLPPGAPDPGIVRARQLARRIGAAPPPRGAGHDREALARTPSAYWRPAMRWRRE